MKAVFKIYNGGNGTEYSVYNRAGADFRLDEELDTGSVQVINDSAVPVPQMSMAEVVFSDDESEISLPAYCFDMVEIRRRGYCVHNLTLVEPTRRFMGLLTDGLKVTQPTEESGEEKKSLYEVTQRLLNTYVLRRANKSSEFTLTTDSKITELLESTESPEFAWEAETQLWECLQEIGNVINCIPRLEANAAKTAFNVVTFDAINEVTEEREL